MELVLFENKENSSKIGVGFKEIGQLAEITVKSCLCVADCSTRLSIGNRLNFEIDPIVEEKLKDNNLLSCKNTYYDLNKMLDHISMILNAYIEELNNELIIEKHKNIVIDSEKSLI